MALSLVSGPAIEPVTVSDAKLYCRQDIADDDSLFVTLIGSARRYIETFTRRALITQTWEYRLDEFPCNDLEERGVIELPISPVQSITSITYVDMNGATQTWSPTLYQTDLPSGPKPSRARIMPAYLQFYPIARCQFNSVVIRFVAGYGDRGSSVPDDLKTALLGLVSHWYNQGREPYSVGVGVGAIEVPMTARALLTAYKSY